MSDAINPFACFNLNPSVVIDWQYLDQIYYAMQHATHPDRFTAYPLAVQNIAAQRSATINTAYQRLKNPIERLWAVVEAHGHFADRTQNIDSHPDIIGDVFDLQDAKAHLKSNAQYHDFKNHLQSLINTAEAKFVQDIDNKCFDQATIQIYWMTYLHKLIIDTDEFITASGAD